MIRAAFVALALLAAVASPAMAQPLSLEARLDRVESDLAIRRVLADYAGTLDRRDYDGYVNLFTADGEWTNAGGARKGRDAIRAMLVGMFGPSGTPNAANYHVISNPQVDFQSADRATAVSRYVFMVRGPEGQPTPRSAGIYHDDLLRDLGVWKIKRRVVEDIMPTAEDWARIRAAAKK